jgi:NAD(P)-dependent dehydrogenase (short-subunit alcohol dehydrogenase family)
MGAAVNNSLNGKVAVISGGASGIGLATAALFARHGAQVIAFDLQEAPPGAENEELDFPITSLRVDLTRPEQVNFAVRHVIDQFGRVDILVHSAGGSGRKWGDGPLHLCTQEGWEKTIDLNLNSFYHVGSAVLQEMILQNKGVILSISSVLGLVGGDQDFATHAYAASKGALISLTRAIAAYYAPNHIRANVICPGLIATPMSERAQQDERIRGRLDQLQPLTSDFGKAQDVAQAALYLASDAASFVTGAVLTVDGGWTVR